MTAPPTSLTRSCTINPTINDLHHSTTPSFPLLLGPRRHSFDDLDPSLLQDPLASSLLETLDQNLTDLPAPPITSNLGNNPPSPITRTSDPHLPFANDTDDTEICIPMDVSTAPPDPLLQPVAEPPPVSSLNQTKTPSQPIKCGVCLEEVIANYTTPCRHCQSARCHTCLRNQFTTALRDMALFPVTCCGSPWHFDVARGLVPEVDLNKYMTRFEEKTDPHPLYCPVETCSAFISYRLFSEHSDTVKCPTCTRGVCVKCKQLRDADAAHACRTFDPLLAMLKKFKYKVCPKCGIAVARMYGCSHMKCLCGAHWCWDCRRSIVECNESCQGEGGDGDGDGDEDQGEYADGDVPMQSVEEAEQDVSGEIPSQILDETPLPIVEERPTQTTPVPVTEHLGPPETQQPTSPEILMNSFTNLDDPHATRWESAGADFGAEPSEGWADSWGCDHRHFGRFTRERMPPFWLYNVAHDQLEIKIRCMACFKDMDISRAPGDVNRKHQEQLEDAKEVAYQCDDCAILYCWDCKAVK